MRAAMSAALMALLLGALPMAVSAQKTDIANPKVLLPNLDLKTIEPVVKETGAEVETLSDDQGSYLQGSFGSTRLHFYPSSCASGDTGCLGLEIGATINRSEFAKLSDAELDKRINRFNDRYVAAKAIRSKNGSVAVTRFLIADHGLPRGNLAVEIAVISDMIGNFFTFMDAETAPE